MRRAARTDANQGEIQRALEAIGARVLYIKEPVDLLVGFRKRNVLLEVKTDAGRMTKAQEAFFATWNGEAHIVHDVQSALEAVCGKEAMR